MGEVSPRAMKIAHHIHRRHTAHHIRLDTQHTCRLAQHGHELRCA